MAGESSYLNSFFEYLNYHKIDYCVMNNYSDYPEVIPSDIDIVVPEMVFNHLDLLIKNYSKLVNLPVIQKIWHGYNKCAYILSPHKLGTRFRLQLDFFVDFTAKGYYKLLQSDLVLNTKRTYKNFFVPDICLEVVFLIMRRIVKDDSSSEKIKEIRKLTRDHEFDWRKIEELFDERMMKFCKEYLSLSPQDHKSRIAFNRKYLYEYSKNNSNILYRLSYRLSELPRLYNRITHPVGLSICFLSPDGAGKSTVIHQVAKLLDGSFHGVKTFYWRPRWLPPMGQLKFWNPSPEASDNPNPHGHTPQNPLKSLVRFFYYSIDFIFGYYFVVLPSLIKKNLVCFDRYYYDYFVDLHRYRMSIPRWLPKILFPLVPKPDVVIILSASPEIMMSRKRELSVAELTRQHKAYNALIEELPNCYLVDSERPLDEVCEEVTEIVLRKKTMLIEQSVH